MNLGNRLNKIASTLGENIESTLGLELDRTNSTVDYFEYILLKEKDKRIDLTESIKNQRNNSDVINIKRSHQNEELSLRKDNSEIEVLVFHIL